MASVQQATVGKIIDLTPENADEWREARASSGDVDAIDHVLPDKLDRPSSAGLADEARAFARMVFKGDLPLERALELYLDERSEGNPFGFDLLAKTTTLDVRSSVRHLVKFLGKEHPTLSDVTPDAAFRFRTEYMPLVAGLKPKTVNGRGR